MKFTVDKRNSGKTQITYRGQHLSVLYLDAEKPATIDQVREYMTVYSKKYREKGKKGKVIVSCLFPFGWRSGYTTEIGQDVDVYDPNNWYNQDVGFDEKCTRVAMYVIGGADAAGGCDKYNDCLFHCIRQAYGGEENMPQPVDKPWKLKKLLGLERNDKVPLDKLSAVENELPKCSITVYGDYQYISSKQAPMNIKLKLSNEHFTLVNNDNRVRTKKVKFNPVRKENVYSYTMGPCRIYNGDEREVSKDEITAMLKSQDYIMLRADPTLEETRAKYITLADEMLAITHDKINMYKYPSVAVASMDIFRYMSKLLKEPEPISAVEASIISKAFQGGLLYAKKGYEGFGIIYDVNSMYPAMLIDMYLQFAMGEGEPMTLTDEEFEQCIAKKHFKYGFYRCRVERSGNDDVDKFFKFSYDHHYTHFDLLLAAELGLKMALVQDGQYNHYHYDRSKLVPAKKIFSQYVEFFFNLKKQNKCAKELLNCLWGALCQKQRRVLLLKAEQSFNIDDDVEITSIKPSKNGGIKVGYHKAENVYATDYARIGPFLTSYARLKLVRAIKPYAANIVRIHTDSFCLDSKVKVDVKVGTDIGQWKVEYEGQITVNNVNDVDKHNE